MIYTMKFFCNNSTKEVNAEDFRKSVIAKCEKSLSPDDIAKILGHFSKEAFSSNARKIPHLIFSKPYNNLFMLKAYEDEGLELLNRVKKVLLDGDFIVSGKEFSITSFKLYNETLYPSLTDNKIKYKTLTPILFYKRNKRKIFDAIYFKNRNDKVKMREELIKDSSAIFRAKIKNILCTFKGKDDYSFFDEVDIKWNDLKIIMINDKGVKTPAFVGEFESHWELPRVIGDRVGIGYGQIHRVYKDNK